MIVLLVQKGLQIQSLTQLSLLKTQAVIKKAWTLLIPWRERIFSQFVRECYPSKGGHWLQNATIRMAIVWLQPDACFKPNLQQKGVDTKIGLDIAWASYEKIAKNIILVTGDSDFTPAMKTARRNGLFVYLYTLNHGVRADILNNADVLNIDPVTSFI